MVQFERACALGHLIFFFFRLASNAFPHIGSVGRIKKKTKQKNHRNSLKRKPDT